MNEAQLTGSHPIAPGGPSAEGRLAVELRVVGFHATLWTVATIMTVAWAVALLSPEQFARLPWPRLAAPMAVAFAIDMIALVAFLPPTRWRRGGSLMKNPSPWPVLITGVLASPAFVWLWLRHRRARGQAPAGGHAVEAAFERLTALPRRASLALGLTLGPALATAAILIVLDLPLPRGDVLSWILLTSSTSLPFIAISYSRTHAMLRPELLTAPRDPTRRLRFRRDLRVRLGLPASVACIGAVLAPLITAHMWQRAQSRAGAVADAEAVAEQLVLGQGRDANEALGRFLGRFPEVTVRQGSRSYGPPSELQPSESGPVDADADGYPESFVSMRGPDLAIVPIVRTEAPIPYLLALSALMVMLVGFFCIWIIAQGVRDDVLRAGRQVRRVARGLVPEPLRVDSFNSLELRELVRAVDRLVARIAEANVAKFVVIEKAQEADRLRSQFLANMSHDLRSPLNSVLGFSELLLSGIDGQLTESQAEMCRVIQSSGRFLLQQIDEILDTAKIDAGRMELHAEPTPPTTLVSRAVKKARDRITPGIDIRTETDAGLPPTFTDPYRAVQAIENVLVFAAERVAATDVLYVRASAEKDLQARGRRVLIEVITPVPPATMEQLDRVLEGFFRIPGHRGLGLGLPLAGGVLELHGGSLDIDEDAAHMRFLLRFPVPERRRRTRNDPGPTLAPPDPSARGILRPSAQPTIADRVRSTASKVPKP